MPEVQAFRGYRYDLGRVGVLGDVVAPPYDVIDPALQDALYQRSPYNVVRLILNKESPADSEKDNRYSRSASTLTSWLQDRILVQDSARSLYVYHQEFEVEGRQYTRKGFMARVRLERFGEGRIFPHEETMPGPKADRLKLFRATAMNLSQVFSLYPDREGEVQATLDRAVGRSLALQATDHLGVVNKFWPVSDQKAVSAALGLMGPKPIFIADGHHRYETALQYLDERRQAGEAKNPESPANFILMMLVSMQDPGLTILPTHRLVSGIGDLRADQLRAIVGEHFELEIVGTGPDAARSAWERIEAGAGQELLGFGTMADGVWQLARFTNPAIMAQVAANHSPAWRELAVAVLHKLVLEKLLSEAGQGRPSCRYVHSLNEVNQVCDASECQLAALVPPATMSAIEKIAGTLEKMPAKSTYFYPKVLSGLVFHSLKS